MIAAFKYLKSFTEKRKKTRCPEDVETNELKKNKFHLPKFIEHFLVPHTVLVAKHPEMTQKTDKVL